MFWQRVPIVTITTVDALHIKFVALNRRNATPPFITGKRVMRVHFSTFVTIFVALLFVAGTVGCLSNGGTWYNPKSYTWTKPFGKDSQAPPYTPDALANPKPSLDSHPNIDRPAGGYSDESSLQANRSAAQSGPSSGYSHDQGGYQNTVATNPYGSYSVAEPSPYPPTYASGQPTVASTAPQQYQYQPEIVQ